MLAASVRQTQAQRAVYDDLDMMFQAFGMTDEQLAESDRQADAWFPPDSTDTAKPTPDGEASENGVG
ncbi:MAG: hypothetical protein ACRDHP_02355 [Ktedonobacterales bacterium]